jgi:hypothetical protein
MDIAIAARPLFSHFFALPILFSLIGQQPHYALFRHFSFLRYAIASCCFRIFTLIRFFFAMPFSAPAMLAASAPFQFRCHFIFAIRRFSSVSPALNISSISFSAASFAFFDTISFSDTLARARAARAPNVRAARACA